MQDSDVLVPEIIPKLSRIRPEIMQKSVRKLPRICPRKVPKSVRKWFQKWRKKHSESELEKWCRGNGHNISIDRKCAAHFWASGNSAGGKNLEGTRRNNDAKADCPRIPNNLGGNRSGKLQESHGPRQQQKFEPQFIIYSFLLCFLTEEGVADDAGRTAEETAEETADSECWPIIFKHQKNPLE